MLPSQKRCGFDYFALAPLSSEVFEEGQLQFLAWDTGAGGAPRMGDTGPRAAERVRGVVKATLHHCALPCSPSTSCVGEDPAPSGRGKMGACCWECCALIKMGFRGWGRGTNWGRIQQMLCLLSCS